MGRIKTGNDAPVAPPAALVLELAEALRPLALDGPTRARMRRRILAAAGDALPAGFQVQRAAESDWHSVWPGVSMRRLRLDSATGIETSLWRLDAQACIPSHDHACDEECLVIEGEVEQGSLSFAAGDYLHAVAGSHHQRMRALRPSLLLIRAAALPSSLSGLTDRRRGKAVPRHFSPDFEEDGGST